MAYLLCEDCGVSFRVEPLTAGKKCPDCGRYSTIIQEDDEE